MRDKAREEAVLKRYGKEVEIYTDLETNDKKEIIKATCKWVSKKGKIYFLIEELIDGLTNKVILKRDDREWIYINHLQAEVSLIDLISEE